MQLLSKELKKSGRFHLLTFRTKAVIHRVAVIVIIIIIAIITPVTIVIRVIFFFYKETKVRENS